MDDHGSWWWGAVADLGIRLWGGGGGGGGWFGAGPAEGIMEWGGGGGGGGGISVLLHVSK